MALIAWIEDDHQRINSLVRLLKNDTHEIKTYGSWKEVEENIETVCASDIIILDIILPPIDEDPYSGLTILTKLRQEYHYQGPVVICSRVQNQWVIDRLKDLDIVEILHKPVRPSVLYGVVTEALEDR